MIRCWGITVIFFIIIILLLFISWWIKYSNFINSKILVTTKVPAYKIEAKVNGRITHLFVKYHKKVKKGQILALLTNPADYQDVITLKKVLYATVTDPSGLSFSIEHITFLYLGKIEPAYVTFDKSYNPQKYQTYRRLGPHTHEIFSNK
ncbi:MAG: biotin/lipoyl-binding protein [Flavobacteriales bacterium]